MFVLIVSVIVLFISYIIFESKRPKNYPPGPQWYPYIGNLHQLKKRSRELKGQHLALIDLAKEHNTNILGLKLGNKYVVTVFGYNLVKQVLTNEEFEGRPDNFFIRLRSMGTRKGVTCTDGELWKTQRQFVTSHLRSLGYGKKPMEYMIKEEIKEIIDLLEENHENIEIEKLLAPSVLNILWALTAGYRFNRKDERLNKLLDLLSLRSRAFDMSGGTLSHLPWLRFIAPEKTGFSVVTRLNSELKQLLMDTIQEHYTTWSVGNNEDLIYSFISQIKDKNNQDLSFNDDQLVMVCLDIFIAGSQTTSNTLGFAFLSMILNPGIQDKLHKHIDENLVLDKSVVLDYSDRHKLPYVEAVLLEVERFFHVTPTSGPRRVLRDTTLGGYVIPKETTVLLSMYSVHYDKEFWGDPENFRPERFLDENGKIVYSERHLPFGLGRRRCLGEVLARNCIFIFFTEIMRKYKVILTPGTQKPTGMPLPGITLSPEIYKANFVHRFEVL